MTDSPSKKAASAKLRCGAAYAVPLSDGSIVPAVLRATNVIFGGCALAFADKRVAVIEEAMELEIASEDQVLGFLLTHPTVLTDGSWPFLTENVAVNPSLNDKLNADKIINPIVLPVSVVKQFLEACMGLRDWDRPLNERWKPEDLLMPGRRRPSRSRRRLNVLPK